MRNKVIKVGIMPEAAFRDRVIDIAAGRVVPKRGEPKIWFHSLKSATEILSDSNRELLKMIVEERPELSTYHPALFTGIDDSFKPRELNFRTHPGAVDYLNRDSPSFFERYAELSTLVITLLLTFLSGVLAFQRWRKQAKKDRIDLYYAELLNIRSMIPELSETDREKMLLSVKQIETRAYEQLINEHLLANESFLILLTMCNNIRSELSGPK